MAQQAAECQLSCAHFLGFTSHQGDWNGSGSYPHGHVVDLLDSEDVRCVFCICFRVSHCPYFLSLFTWQISMKIWQATKGSQYISRKTWRKVFYSLAWFSAKHKCLRLTSDFHYEKNACHKTWSVHNFGLCRPLLLTKNKERAIIFNLNSVSPELDIYGC